MSHAGKRNEANSDFVCRGGMLTINLLISPDSTFSNFSPILRWCSPSTNPGQTVETNVKKESLAFAESSSCVFLSSNFSNASFASLASIDETSKSIRISDLYHKNYLCKTQPTCYCASYIMRVKGGGGRQTYYI